MNHKIIDTNVPLVASNMATQTSDTCHLAVVEFIRQGLIEEQSFKVVFDQLDKVLEEYSRYFYPSDHDSLPLGYHFFLHALINCIQVNITETDTGEFAEYPADERLATFDPSDRKWVAMAIAHQQQYGSPAPIVNAVDSDWLPVQPILAEYGVQVEQICPA